MNTQLTAKKQNIVSLTPVQTSAIYAQPQFTGAFRQAERPAAVATPSARRVEMYPAETRRSSFIDRLTELIEANLDDETFDITRLCLEAGASRTQIHHKVKKWTGLSTSKFIRDIKLRRAKVLLLQTDLNITQVAYEVGFQDSHYFSRVFHESYGMCPRDFRKSQLGFSFD